MKQYTTTFDEIEYDPCGVIVHTPTPIVPKLDGKWELVNTTYGHINASTFENNAYYLIWTWKNKSFVNTDNIINQDDYGLGSGKVRKYG